MPDIQTVGPSKRLAPLAIALALFLFELIPPQIQIINHLLSLSDCVTKTAKTARIARDRGVFERRALGVKVLLSRGDTFFDGGKLAGLNIGEFLFSKRRRCDLRQ